MSSSASSSPPAPLSNPFAALSVGKSFKVKTVDLTVDDDSKARSRKHRKDKRKHTHRHHRGDESPHSRKHHQHHKKRRRSPSVSSSASEPARDRSELQRTGDVTFTVGSFEFFADSIGSAFGNGKCFRPEVPPVLKRLVNSGGRRDALRDAPLRYYDKKAVAATTAVMPDHWEPPREKCEMPGVDDAFLDMAPPKKAEAEGRGDDDHGDVDIADERDLKVSLGELESENRRLVQACRSHPERVSNWMEFIRHQKKWMASLGIDKASIEDKIRTILEDAVKSSPGTPRLWQLRLLDHPSPDRKQDRVLWTRAMREPSVASALASSCVQTLVDSSSHSEEAGRDPEALLDVVTGSGVLSSLSMEVVYDILCRVAMYDMEKAVMLFRGVATRALFQKVSPVLGTPSAHYALVGQNIMNVNPGYLGVCESVDASQSAPGDADVEFKLGQALENFPESPILGWVAKEFALEAAPTPKSELTPSEAHLVGRLARDLTKRDGIELVLRLVDILCGSAINSLQRYSCRHP
ncbi:hypothetical protein FOZ63_020185, partial [Perkinsus olseni]